MAGVKDKIWFLREGLFAKYVIALVGLVVFVLAVNGALEIWISYRGIKTSLTDGMSEKAEATAKTDRAIDGRPRAADQLGDARLVQPTPTSPNPLEQRRADYAQLLRQVPPVSQLSLLNGQGREQLRLSRRAVTFGSNAGFLPRRPLHRNPRPRHQLRAGLFPGRAAVDVDRDFAFGRQRHRRRHRSALPRRISSATARSARWPLPISSMPRARCWRVRPRGPEIGKDLSALPQVAAVIAPHGAPLAAGTDASGQSVLTTSSAVPKLGWHVFFEQPTAQALTPIRDQLVRIALLITLGLVVAIIAGTILARRMLVPITALRAGARRLGAGDFGHRIEVKTADELEELANQFNSMAGQLARDLFRPRREGEGADPRSRAVDQRAEGARGSRPRGRLLARSQRRAADGRRPRARNHPCRCGADLRL